MRLAVVDDVGGTDRRPVAVCRPAAVIEPQQKAHRIRRKAVGPVGDREHRVGASIDGSGQTVGPRMAPVGLGHGEPRYIG